MSWLKFLVNFFIKSTDFNILIYFDFEIIYFVKIGPNFVGSPLSHFKRNQIILWNPTLLCTNLLDFLYPQAWNSTTGIAIPFKQPAQEHTLVATLELLDKLGVLPKFSSSRKIAESPLFAEKFEEPNSFWLFWPLFCRLNLPIILFTQAEVRLYMPLLSTI